MYYVHQGEDTTVLLLGGTKRNQNKDIDTLQNLAQDVVGVKHMKSDSQIQKETKTMKTRQWDAADYLETPQDIAHYLEVVFEEGDSSLIAAALGDVARSKGMTVIATETGLGRESLYKALSPEGNPGFSYVLSVLKALGLRLRPVELDIESMQSRKAIES